MIPISNGNDTYNLGVITVPSFYLNFEELNAGVKDYRSTTRDVKKIDYGFERARNGRSDD